MGVRRTDLWKSLGSRLRVRWAIASNDPESTRAHVIFLVDYALSTLPDGRARLIGAVAYNTVTEVDMRDERYLEQRLKKLHALKGKGYDDSTTSKQLRMVIEHVVAMLSGLVRTPSAAELHAIIDRERAYHAFPAAQVEAANPGVDALATFRVAVGAIHGETTAPPAIEMFLRLPLHMHGETGQLHIERTRTEGHWLCTFTSADLLNGYRESIKTSGATRPCWQTIGADLIAQLRKLPFPVGIVVDPTADPDGDIRSTLMLPPKTLATIDIGG
jgi:hypothetical protein